MLLNFNYNHSLMLWNPITMFMIFEAQLTLLNYHAASTAQIESQAMRSLSFQDVGSSAADIGAGRSNQDSDLGPYSLSNDFNVPWDVREQLAVREYALKDQHHLIFAQQ
ncbi:hypothetical protein SERLADRAFT_434283 [Serpula lacrymans var. lacrymans S7.9]|uniref:Uncharacterized protein n=1 Tax=Serpula lacrymans var. lacrymans (strain S7.9) TaxID=578457 RepID=F8NKB0_SERL9|nr:uncharacterized protein SERLADRAFT_434283 [Serpula lacrymans var. lacrymans S7.9]EGO28376.1 hypothetical protein SERLADRAFT_434283 [Serpula lacrymans var. lacrymans S7.9]